MKMGFKKLFWVSLLSIIVGTSLFAAPAKQKQTTLTGEVALSNATYTDLTVMGTLDAENLKVNSLKVYGAADIKGLIATSVEVYGPLDMKSLKTDKLDVKGPLKLKKSMIHKALHASGNIDIKMSKIAKADIKGNLDVQDVKFLNDFTLVGNMSAKRCNFKKITTISDEIKLKNVNAQMVFIKDNKQEKKQVVILEGTTVIDSAITFERPGIVVIKGKKVSYGKIDNAEIEQ